MHSLRGAGSRGAMGVRRRLHSPVPDGGIQSLRSAGSRGAMGLSRVAAGAPPAPMVVSAARRLLRLLPDRTARGGLAVGAMPARRRSLADTHASAASVEARWRGQGRRREQQEVTHRELSQVTVSYGSNAS